MFRAGEESGISFQGRRGKSSQFTLGRVRKVVSVYVRTGEKSRLSFPGKSRLSFSVAAGKSRLSFA